MFSGLATKVALKKVGLPSNTFDFSAWTAPSEPGREPNKLRKKQPEPGKEDDGWGGWISSINIPLTVHPWLAPPPPPIKVAEVPAVGCLAPVDRDRKLRVGNGRRTLVVFLRCVGCAFAQKTFLTLRTLSNRYSGMIRCIAVSHSSTEATKKWLDLMGGAWSVEVIIDEDRAIYAAWGLGLGNMWYLFHPGAQIQGWKETGWLGGQVAERIQKKGPIQDDDDAATALGSKWQEAGAFAIDGKGTVIWGGKAVRSDDMMNLEEGARILEL